MHPNQAMIRDDDTRFKVLSCGRRWGKTWLGMDLCYEAALRGGRAWWIGPTFRQTIMPWKELIRMVVQLPFTGIEISKADRIISFPTEGEISVRSGQDPDTLRGEGLDLVVLDECATMKEEVWTEALRPALADRRGRAVFIGTPKGRNWFWRLFSRGQEEQYPAWSSWQLPTMDNPYIDPEELEEARSESTERVYRQEFLADFIDEGAGVFRYVLEAATAEEQERAEPEGEYSIGVDWGKSEDFTVFSVVDVKKRAVVYVDRSNRVDYAIQRGRLAALAERFRPRTILAEENSIGGPILEQLRRDGLRVKGFTTTNATKAAIVDALALAFEQRAITIIPHTVLMSELDAYAADRLPSGAFRYSAPSGTHDDTVMATALAWEAGFGGRKWRPGGELVHL